MASVLVTGGTGYIGSHTVIELINAGFEVVVLDNLERSSKVVLDRLETITKQKIRFYKCDILDKIQLGELFSAEDISAVVHFAGLKAAVAESPFKPFEYYQNNVVGTMNLIDVMRNHNCKSFVYSSSGIVYGNPIENPVTEKCPKGECPNPYGRTKSMVEQILKDVQKADDGWNVIVLRYFNPIGAHKSGLIGENPLGVPSHLIPYVMQVAIGKRRQLNVFGDDYDTPDGTGVRDYIHVVDLAQAHVKAVERMMFQPGYKVYNLGTGHGYSVFDIVNAFEKITGKCIPYAVLPRREGDIASCYADTSLANRELGWKAEYGILEMCQDSWKWQINNPNGYEDN